ncbi:hypothetical protein F8388_018556 [Cannabis sativa]|uniref:DUF4283 domain-containing protein n=1 Tax=Cannabis sativa TaxID=3483 RepID=A0A7J6EEY0_CANSA|nr:hypothetical protein F8388_018556 [Cannabis sativa]KAF4403620.1 hypothetical protein G4B88_002473 [Cannabis sativa]
MVTLSNDGGSVRICERTRLFGYEIGVTIDAADWMSGILEELKKKIGQQRDAFKRFFRNSSGSYFMECFANSNGAFLKISTLKNNKVRMVIIPEEAEAKGWSNLNDCLLGVLKRKPENAQDGVKQQKEVKIGECRKNSQSWAKNVERLGQHVTKPMGGNVVKQGKVEWRELYPEINLGFKPRNLYPGKRFYQPKFYEYMRSKAQPRDWSLPIFLARDNIHAEWSTIFFNLSRELERKLIVCQLFDDRCTIWCKDEMEKEELVKVQRMYVPGAQSYVTFSLWSWDNQKNNVKVECKGSWIGVQGLPLNLWHMRIFRKIRDMCGGLMDVDKATAEANFDNEKVFGDGDVTEGEGKKDGDEEQIEGENLREANLDNRVMSDCEREDRDGSTGDAGGDVDKDEDDQVVFEVAAAYGREGGPIECKTSFLHHCLSPLAGFHFLSQSLVWLPSCYPGRFTYSSLPHTEQHPLSLCHFPVAQPPNLILVTLSSVDLQHMIHILCRSGPYIPIWIVHSLTIYLPPMATLSSLPIRRDVKIVPGRNVVYADILEQALEAELLENDKERGSCSLGGKEE